MSSGGGGFFNQFTPRGRGGGGAPGGHQETAARAGVSITLDPKVLEEAGEVSPLRTRRSMNLLMMTGIYMGGINTLYAVLSALLNTWPGGTLFSIWMAPLPRAMMPGDRFPHLKMLGWDIKVRIYTLL